MEFDSALVIGAGSIGTRRIKLLRKLGVRVAVCEVDSAKFTYLKELGVTELYSDPQEAVEMSDASVCLICTLSSSHVELAIQAACAGMNLFIEKPLSNEWDPVALCKLTEAVRNHSVWAKMGMSYRFLPSLRRFAVNLPTNIVGANFWAGQNLEDWGTSKDLGYHVSIENGGVIRDSLPHTVDMIHWIIGDIDSVYARASSTGRFGLVSDICDVFFETRRGQVVTAHVDYLQIPRKNRVTILANVAPGINCLEWEFNPLESDLMYHGEMQALNNAVERDLQTQPDLAEGIYNLEILNLINRSIASGTRIDCTADWRRIWKGTA